jgi:hypothetical protein
MDRFVEIHAFDPSGVIKEEQRNNSLRLAQIFIKEKLSNAEYSVSILNEDLGKFIHSNRLQNYLYQIKESVEIRIITRIKTIKENNEIIYKREDVYNALKTIRDDFELRGNNICIRNLDQYYKGNLIHDRIIIVDKDIFLLGHNICSIGEENKGYSVAAFIPFEILGINNEIIEDFNNLWKDLEGFVIE